MALPNHRLTSLPDALQICISSGLIIRQMIILQSSFHNPLRGKHPQPFHMGVLWLGVCSQAVKFNKFCLKPKNLYICLLACLIKV